MRAKRSISKNEIIIVCEGSSTEYNYFTDLKEYVEKHQDVSPYTFIRILPAVDERVQQNNGRQPRHLMGDKAQLQYYESKEANVADYEKYKAQPVRYVREAELQVIENDYTEGWAVFDWDEKTTDPDKKQKKHDSVNPILDRNPGRVFVAFSSYSFEQWLLCHYECCDRKFTVSDHEADSKHSAMCGSPMAVVGKCCDGNDCMAGYLRVKSYIPSYKKEDKSLFTTITLQGNKVSRKALFNASLLRHSFGPRFSERPYTDVDILVCKLINDEFSYHWVSLDVDFLYNDTMLRVTVDGKNITIVNTGSRNCVLPQGKIYWGDEYQSNLTIVNPKSIFLEPDKTETFKKSKHKYLYIETLKKVDVLKFKY